MILDVYYRILELSFKILQISKAVLCKVSDRQKASFLNIIHLCSAGLLCRTKTSTCSNKQLFLAYAEWKVVKKTGTPYHILCGLKAPDEIKKEKQG